MFKIKGSKVNTFIDLIEEEFALEVDYLVGRLALERKKLIKQGMKAAAADKFLAQQIKAGEGYYKTFANKMSRIISESMKQAIAEPVREFSKENPQQKYEWVLGSVKTSHCPDCLELSGKEPRTIDEWLELGYGLPRDGLTVCNIGCQCMLSPVSK